VGNLDIEQVAADYRDEAGNSLITVTAPRAAVEAYASGSINRKVFLAQVDLDFSNLAGAVELGALIRDVPGCFVDSPCWPLQSDGRAW
jgi:hypothetical protein